MPALPTLPFWLANVLLIVGVVLLFVGIYVAGYDKGKSKRDGG